MVNNKIRFTEQEWAELNNGSKGSDVTSPQTKISDEEIFKQSVLAMEEMYGSSCDAEVDAYFRGAIWYREQKKLRQ